MNDDLATTASALLGITSRRIRDATDQLATLVNLDTSSRAPDSLERASHWIAERLLALGLKVERHPRDGGGPIVIGRAHGIGRHRVLLLAHYDTVFEPGEPARRPFRIDGARAYGPGVADMKGGVIAVWEALRALGEIGWKNFAALTIIHNHDEELGSPGSREVIEAAGRDADLCLVTEPGRPDGAVVTARKGVARYLLRVRGKAAHAGVNPQDGASAVVALAHKIVALHALNDRERETSVNTVVLEGGTRSNIVADTATAEVDIRFPTAAAGEDVLAAVHRIAEASHLPGTRAELSGGINRPPLEPHAGEPLFALATETAAALGIRLRGAHTGGGSDGNFVAALGVPVLDGLGAVGGGYHSADEYLDLPTLPQRAALTALIMWAATRRAELLRSRT